MLSLVLLLVLIWAREIKTLMLTAIIINRIINQGPMLHTVHVPVSLMMVLGQHVNVVLRNVTRLHREKQNGVLMSAEDIIGVINVKSGINNRRIKWSWW